MMIRSVFVAAACLAGGVGLTAAASAGGPQPNVVLTIDITSPTAVVFASTTAPSLITRSVNGDAISFTNLLIGGPVSGAFLSGDLRAAQGSFVFDIFNGQVPSPNFVGGGQAPQTFVAGLRAFSGTSQGNLSAWTFAPVGSLGDITIKNINGVDTGIIIGQYRIIPAPGAAALLGLGGLVATRRRR